MKILRGIWRAIVVLLFRVWMDVSALLLREWMTISIVVAALALIALMTAVNIHERIAQNREQRFYRVTDFNKVVVYTTKVERVLGGIKYTGSNGMADEILGPSKIERLK